MCWLGYTRTRCFAQEKGGLNSCLKIRRHYRFHVFNSKHAVFPPLIIFVSNSGRQHPRHSRYFSDAEPKNIADKNRGRCLLRRKGNRQEAWRGRGRNSRKLAFQRPLLTFSFLRNSNCIIIANGGTRYDSTLGQLNMKAIESLIFFPYMDIIKVYHADTE